SDTTYRLYDYDRRDDAGNTRELHIEQSIDVTTIPHSDQQPTTIINEQDNGTLTTLVSNDFFTVYEWSLTGEVSFEQEGLYTLVSVVDGKGSLQIENDTYELNKGDHFLLPNEI